MSGVYPDAALLLVAHGSRQNADSCAPALQHAAALRQRGGFGQVGVAFCRQPPLIRDVLPTLRARRLFVVPLFIGEGYFTQEFIPRELGLAGDAPGGGPRAGRRGAQTLHYCEPVGTHASMIDVLLARAADTLRQYPLPELSPHPWPLPGRPAGGRTAAGGSPPGSVAEADVTLFLAGHGTHRNENSRTTIERHAACLRARRRYAAVHAVFLEEPPRIPDCYSLASTRYLVVVPCFISDGLHTTEDIPELLGGDPEVLRARRARGEWPWRNPTGKRGGWVWYTPSIGSEPHLPDVILERVREATARATAS
jgi:sirohydrochlorin cobaltochelatase